MCSPILCATCRKVTWTGCGEHIPDALAGFSKDQICTCDPDLAVKAGLN